MYLRRKCASFFPLPLVNPWHLPHEYAADTYPAVRLERGCARRRQPAGAGSGSRSSTSPLLLPLLHLRSRRKMQSPVSALGCCDSAAALLEVVIAAYDKPPSTSHRGLGRNFGLPDRSSSRPSAEATPVKRRRRGPWRWVVERVSSEATARVGWNDTRNVQLFPAACRLADAKGRRTPGCRTC